MEYAFQMNRVLVKALKLILRLLIHATIIRAYKLILIDLMYCDFRIHKISALSFCLSVCVYVCLSVCLSKTVEKIS